MHRIRPVLALCILGIAAVPALDPSFAGAAGNRDILQDIDLDQADPPAVAKRLDKVTKILATVDARLDALDASFAGPAPCVASPGKGAQQHACQQAAALDMIAAQAGGLLWSVDSLEGDGDTARPRRLDHVLSTLDAAGGRLAGIIGPELAGIIDPELAGIIGPELVQAKGATLEIIGPELAGIIDPEVSAFGPVCAGIIDPEVVADAAGIIGPELAGIIGPERADMELRLDDAIAHAEATLVVALAAKRALEPPSKDVFVP